MPSIRELREICQKPVLYSVGENWYGRLVSRKFSIYFTWLFLKLGLSPNQVTILHIFSGVTGSLIFLRSGLPSIIAGIVLYQLWLIFDCSDGEVARYTKRYSEKGIYLDYLGHYLFNPLVMMPIVVMVIAAESPFAIWLGIIFSFMTIFKRLTADLMEILKARRVLETANQRYNFESQPRTDQVKPIVGAPARVILFIYNTVTMMLVVSAAMLLEYVGVKAATPVFYFYTLTLPLAVAAGTYTIYRREY